MKLLWDILTDLFAFAWVTCLLLTIFLGPFIALATIVNYLWGTP